jgi:hypothetical protein
MEIIWKGMKWCGCAFTFLIFNLIAHILRGLSDVAQSAANHMRRKAGI